MPDELRPVRITNNVSKFASGSARVNFGDTEVLCTAMVEDRVPRHCADEQIGWVTAEYAMLPSANADRKSLHGQPGGRTREIERLIGRSLRLAVDLSQIGTRTIWIDCSVIHADGGTRTASITGGFVALADALWQLYEDGTIGCMPITYGVSAVSVGIVEGIHMLDLCAAEDRAAAVDMNIVKTHSGEFVEIQGTAESKPFGDESLAELMALASKGLAEIQAVQKDVLGDKLNS
jgi:ribonuclease PH